MVEGVRLESVCALTGYRGFESHPLRNEIAVEVIRSGPAVSQGLPTLLLPHPGLRGL